MSDKILVVDDEREIADVIGLYLQNENFEVVKCYNGKDAKLNTLHSRQSMI